MSMIIVEGMDFSLFTEWSHNSDLLVMQILTEASQRLGIQTHTHVHMSKGIFEF